MSRHTVGGARSAGASLFLQGENLASLVEAANSVTPKTDRGSLVFIVDAGRIIGHDATRGNVATPFYTVVTNASRDLVTLYPGLPKWM